MKYKNIEPPFYPQDFTSVLRWAVAHRLMGRRREAPARYKTPRVAVDEALWASTEPSITWVGHATWIVRVGGLTIWTDPNWSESLGPGVPRNASAALPLDRAPRPDVVVISHNHRDHFDAPTVKAIARAHPGVTVIVPEGDGPLARRCGHAHVVEMTWWAEHTVERPHGRATVAFVPSQHWSRRGAFDQNDSLWGGFVMRGGDDDAERKVYFAGDTAYFSGFAEIGRRYPSIDAALLPIGAYDPEWFMRRQHMNPEDATRAFRDLGAKLLCAMHWGTFKLTDEPLDEPPLLLEDERRKQGVAAEQVWVAAIGASRLL